MVPDSYDKFMSYVRTFWPLILGHLAALLYAAARWLEHRTGDTLPARAARFVGQLLLSLGLPAGPPSYTTPPPTRE